MLRFLRNQKGAAAAIVGIALPVMLGMGALVIDVGNLYLNKTQVSAAADAAVLAGAQELPKDPAAAQSIAYEYAARNGKDGDQAQATVSGTNNDTMQVTITRNVPLIFAPVLNIGSSAVSATATAQVSVAASVPWIVPFVLPKTQYFDYDHVFTMRMYGASNPYFNPKYEDAKYQMDYMNVGIENTNFSQYIQYLKYGYQKKFTIGNNMQYLGPSSGGVESVNAFYDRTVRDPNTDYTKARVGDPRVMLIPLVDSMLPRTTPEGTPMKIVGFVGFFLEEVHKEYSTKFWAKGRFLKDLNVGSGDSTSNPAYDFGVRTIKLIH